MKKEEMTTEDRQIQKVLNKILSEELVAHMFYMGCTVATCPCKGQEFSQMFIDIAEDELNDHFMKIKTWAIANDYEVPFKFKDYEKYASESFKQVENLKKEQEAIYYVNEAIKSEQDAIKSYEEALSVEALPYDLHAALTQNYYDECEHLNSLTILKYALENGAELIHY